MTDTIEDMKDDTEVDYADKEDLMNHKIEDLFYSSHPISKYFRGQAAYFLYIFRVAEYLYIAIYMDWTVAFRHPINFFILLIFFVVSSALLFVAGLFLLTHYLVSTLLRCTPKHNTVIESWTEILKKVNPDSNLIDDLKNGMKLLGTRMGTKSQNELENLERLNKLKAILFFSTLVYKRETEVTSKIQNCINELENNLKDEQEHDKKIYKKVYERLLKYEKKIKDDNNNIENDENENKYTADNIERKIRDMIDKDENKVRDHQFKDFDLNYLNFTSVSELNTSDGGSFCGMFWSDIENFIVVSFKGTTPTNFAEWLGNLTFQCVDARSYLFGQVHRGFYNYLFPIDEERAGKNYPCQKIIDAINIKATTLKKKNGSKVNLWITGHSLGGALATLFYSRLLNINFSHESWELQGAFTFASPAVGDLHFSAQLSSLINDPRNLSKPLWRIVLNHDIIPKLPYRACNKGMRKYGYNYNILMNFAQVGDKITFYGGENNPSSIKEFFSYTSDTNYNGKERVNRLISYCKRYRQKKDEKWAILKRILRSILLPFYIPQMIKSHGTGGYFEALIYYEKKISKKDKTK
ncbi:Alpha/Beta hydrolase protein [Glomus cerebriforme]|uniref:Alpha/Beta hydrolase protein n=1 Tax=Glomus cerebriforme TaxID=658196 RepID=A0A397T551_9GLOM|nr:Alpha/Beta hydrolase protein [Glomus cerebriforme]